MKFEGHLAHGQPQAETHVFMFLHLGVLLENLRLFFFRNPRPGIFDAEYDLVVSPAAGELHRSALRGELQRIAYKVRYNALEHCGVGAERQLFRRRNDGKPYLFTFGHRLM